MRPPFHLTSFPRFARPAVALLLAVTSLLPAQTSLSTGSRIRLYLTDSLESPITATLIGARSDSVYFVSTGGTDTAVTAAARVSLLELSTGRHSRAGHGAAVGAVIGGVLGLALGVAASAEDCSGLGCTDYGPGEVLAVSAVLGGVGALTGALIGLGSHRESWEPVPPPYVTALHPRRVRAPQIRLGLRF